MKKGLNLQDIKNENRALILQLLTESRLSRKEIASKLALTPAAVTKICNELLAEELIEEYGAAEGEVRSGRKEILLQIKNGDRLGLGINAETDSITLSVFTINGELLKSESIPLSDNIDQVIMKAKSFFDNCGYERERFVGAGVCIIGSAKERDFGIWKEENLAEKFENALGLPVAVANNVRAFALSEMLFGCKDRNGSVLLFKWGPGVGSAITSDGRVYTGSDASVTEIGHTIVKRGGRKCRCGRFGCLETEVSEAAIQSDLATNESINDLLKNNDISAINILEHKIDLVALVLANAATMLNIDKIIFFGSMFDNDIVAEALKKQILRYNGNILSDSVILSALNDKGGYIGAAALCANNFFFNRKNI